VAVINQTMRERGFAAFLFAIYSGYAFKMTELTVARQAVAHRGRRLEYFTIVWNGLEGLIAVAAGIVAGSISLVGFGMDSFIEVISGATLLWRMSVDAEALMHEGVTE
jgi:hypothetical protein